MISECVLGFLNLNIHLKLATNWDFSFSFLYFKHEIQYLNMNYQAVVNDERSQ